ncbi:hypothetical protein V1264_012309 [Littorina saxatilis]|uniref:Uncharacterized protein n=1 Tax=Littorina saxatilis TaxID=31220 RepID=A0AAN9BX69_9CAEN
MQNIYFRVKDISAICSLSPFLKWFSISAKCSLHLSKDQKKKTGQAEFNFNERSGGSKVLSVRAIKGSIPSRVKLTGSDLVRLLHVWDKNHPSTLAHSKTLHPNFLQWILLNIFLTRKCALFTESSQAVHFGDVAK